MPSSDSQNPPSEVASELPKSSEKWLEAGLQASKGSRRTFVLLQVFSLLIAVMIANTKYLGWSDDRVRVIQNALTIQRWIELPAMPMRPLPDKTKREETVRNIMAEARFLKLPLSNQRFEDSLRELVSGEAASPDAILVRDWLRPPKLEPPTGHEEAHIHRAVETFIRKVRLAPLEEPELKEAVEYLARNGSNSRQLEDLLTRWTEHRMGNSFSIPVPLVGLRIDINHLGIFAAFGFSIFLGWVGFCFRRESRTLQRMIDLGEWSAIRLLECYQAFIPRPRAVIRGGPFPYFALTVPALLLALAIYIDCHSLSIGKLYSPELTDGTMWVEAVLLAFLIWQTCICYHNYNKLMKSWEAALPHVTFIVNGVSKDKEHVVLTGSFSTWSKEHVRMKRCCRTCDWQVTLRVVPGMHGFSLLVSGEMLNVTFKNGNQPSTSSNEPKRYSFEVHPRAHQTIEVTAIPARDQEHARGPQAGPPAAQPAPGG